MTILTASDLSCQRAGRLVFNDVSLRLEAGGALVVTGPNGAGKSSLLRLLAGLLAPLTGTVTIEDAPSTERRTFGYVGHQDGIKPHLTALENLAFWAGLFDRREAMPRAKLALEAFDIARLSDLPGRFLSAGQRRRLSLGRLLVAPSRIWLLDEPSVALDGDGVSRLESEIDSHRASGGGVIIATHQPLDIPGTDSLALGTQRRTRPLDAEALKP
ncbi:MAG: heme ABC exporter ATP-binding protein CcmA [Pseudomonadota bacterium]